MYIHIYIYIYIHDLCTYAYLYLYVRSTHTHTLLTNINMSNSFVYLSKFHSPSNLLPLLLLLFLRVPAGSAQVVTKWRSIQMSILSCASISPRQSPSHLLMSNASDTTPATTHLHINETGVCKVLGCP